MKKLTLSLLALALFAGSSLTAGGCCGCSRKAKPVKAEKKSSCCKKKCTKCKKSSCDGGYRCDGRNGVKKPAKTQKQAKTTKR